MKLLFLTQVVDARDAILGFVPRWLQGLAARCERVRAVALEVGDTSTLPENVDVREIGRRGVVRRYLRYRAVLAEALRADGFDTVLAHMVPRYALVAEGPARRAGAGLFLWYTSKGVDARLRRAVERVDKVFTASEESLRVPTARRVVTGHGIDVAHFADRGEPPAEPPRILAVGRLTPAKDPLTVVSALARLVERGRDVHLDWAGGGLLDSDDALIRAVEARVAEAGLEQRVHLLGPVPYPEVPALYRRASILVNASLTGSVDKVVLEAMAARRPVVSCNDSIPGVLASLGPRAAELHFEPGDADALADRLERLLDRPAAEREALGAELRGIVEREHEVDTLMGRLVEEMQR